MANALMAEFETPEQLTAALEALHARGYRKLEAYTPYPIEEIDHILSRPRSRLPLAIGAVGFLAAAGAYTLQWWLMARLYPLNVGGRPAHFPLAQVPITFEMGVLFASFTAFIGVIVAARLLQLWRPVDEIDGFERASIDRFWLRIDDHDPQFSLAVTQRELAQTAALRVIVVGEEGPR